MCTNSAAAEADRGMATRPPGKIDFRLTIVLAPAIVPTMDGIAVGFDVQGGGGPRTLTSAVLERLRADILSTKLVPGQKLHIAGLAKQFSVSLTAVREALSRLVADGLVPASGPRGFRVRPASSADLPDVSAHRLAIASVALQRSIDHGGQALVGVVE